ncbi:sarcosine oxidase subunit gamma family protein [Mesorhizobium sp. CAU 1732]|uniref:sarcosine oxidase subunit gamma n=1 Tax=Mesorhizobium sp. CAU 1732 TaxID=3140358 RepID=UPI00325FF7EA
MTDRSVLRYPQLAIDEPSRHQLSLLRARRIDQQQRQRLESVLGAPLPEVPNASTSGDREILWLAPNQWLIRAADTELDIAARIDDACRGMLFHVADVTDAWRAVEIDGRRSADLIAKGCSLDLHPTVFRVGQAKRSLLSQIHVLLHRISGSGYRIYFDVSVWDHVVQWLKVSAEEFRRDPALEGDAETRRDGQILLAPMS